MLETRPLDPRANQTNHESLFPSHDSMKLTLNFLKFLASSS